MKNDDMPIVKNPTYPHKVTGCEIDIGIEARGSIQKTRTYQMTTVTIDGDQSNRRRVQIQYPYHAPVQPETPAQLAWWAVFAAGSAEWVALSAGEKEPWNELAREEYRQRKNHPGSYRVHSGYNLFMRSYLLAR